ncbi:rhodanese-like domain-containing protein [Streptomyces sp. NPDC007088]|uniref:rhodanese-like domain-containing protein n=1 Tax=Streptomyces sp. NPDC007088 TaxID=3364773 RepID=UPI0036ADB343
MNTAPGGPDAPAPSVPGTPSAVVRHLAAPARAAAHFRALLDCTTDVSDVAGALLGEREPDFVLVDTRSAESWGQGHIPGALHLPTATLAAGAAPHLDPAVPVVVHCWGPGCNGAQRAALVLAGQGYRVKELLGGFEYWVREGFAYETAGAGGAARRQDLPDRLTAPLGTADCGC